MPTPRAAGGTRCWRRRPHDDRPGPGGREPTAGPSVRSRLAALVPETPAGRAAALVIVVLVGLNLIAIALDALLPSPEGPRSSAFATAPEGVAAWAELARRSGLDVRTVRERPSAGSLPNGGTVVVLDPEDLTGREAGALRRFAERGGRLVAGGLEPGPWLTRLAGGVEWADAGGEDARVLVPATETGAAARVRTAGEGRWSRAGATLPLVADDDGAVVLLARAGRGRIALVADPSPLQNRLLDEADNAALALALAGEGPLAFMESVHGYSTATGLRALPDRMQWALILLALSGLVLIAARWPRMGPPEPPERPLFPPRRGYVDALAATIARSRDRTMATETVRSAARERLARRAALARDADDEAFAAAARAAGLRDDEARALTEQTDDDGVAAGRALARLSGRG
jgi:hypothetical protein